MADKKKLEHLTYILKDLSSLRNLFAELNFDFADEPVNKENWSDSEKEIVLESKIVAKKDDYQIYYLLTNTDSLKHWKSVATKIIKDNHGFCLVCSHNPSGFKWVFSSLSKEFSKSFTETRHVPIEIRPDIGVPNNFVDFLEKIQIAKDSTPTSISIQISEAFDTFAVQIHDELTVNVFAALKILSDGIIAEKSNNLSLSDETLENVIRVPIFTLLYRIIFILYAEDRGIFPIEDPTYYKKFSLKWIKEEWLLKSTNTKLVEYEVQKRLRDLFKLIELGSEAFDYPKFSMRSYYGRLFDREINSKLDSWKISNSHLIKTLEFLTRTRDKKGNYFFLDYAALETRHLGAIYEHLLEFHLEIKNNKISELPNPKERKASGSYYTSKHIVDYIVQNSIKPLIDKIINENPNKHTQIEKILELKILDPAMGSGHFLVGAVEYIAKRLCEIEFGEMYEEQHYIDLKRDVVRHCIYGVDINPLAVDLASLSLWLETLSSEKPLSFLRSHLKCGNSLIGSEIKSIYGEHDIHSKTTQTTIFESQGSKNAFKKNIKNFLMFENLKDDTPAAVKIKLEEYSKMQSKGTIYKDLQFLLNCKTAEFFGIKLPILFIDYTTEIGENSLDYYSDEDFQKVDTLSKKNRFFHWELEFPQIFYDENGEKKSNSGFDVINGNPPWQLVQPDIDEFFTPLKEMQLHLATQYPKKHQRFSMLTKQKKNNLIKKCLEVPDINTKWNEYLDSYYKQKEFFLNKQNYQHQISEINGKKPTGIGMNLYKLFIEKFYKILNNNGIFGTVLPSGIYSDLGSTGLRKLIFDNCKILEFCAMQNQNGIFRDVHRQFKFCTLIVKKGGITENFLSKFFVVDDIELQNFQNTAFDYNLDLIKKCSPNSLSFIECKDAVDQHILKMMYKFPILQSDKWDIELSREFNMTDDANLFHTSKIGIPLYEGKMMHMFRDDFSTPTYWVNERNALNELKRKELSRINAKTKQKKTTIIPQIHPQEYRLVWRALTNATNKRTLIATILPPNTVTGNSLNYLDPLMFDGKNYYKPITNYETLFLVGMFNSFPIDFILRHKIAANLNMFYIMELPIPRFDGNNLLHQKIFKNSAMLVCTTKKYSKLRDEVGVSEFVTDPAKRMVLEAQITACSAKIYDLTIEELKYILETFPGVNQQLKDLTLDEFSLNYTTLQKKKKDN